VLKLCITLARTAPQTPGRKKLAACMVFNATAVSTAINRPHMGHHRPVLPFGAGVELPIV